MVVTYLAFMECFPLNTVCGSVSVSFFTMVISVSLLASTFVFQMYYADNARGVVNAVHLGSGEEGLFLSYGSQTVYGLVVNWVDRTLLYATDSAVVEGNIDTRVSRTIHTSVSQARHLVIYANTTQRFVQHLVNAFYIVQVHGLILINTFYTIYTYYSEHCLLYSVCN